MMEVVTNRLLELQVVQSSSQIITINQQTNIQFFLQTGCHSCRPTNSVKALKGKISHPMDLPQTHLGVLPTLSLTTNSS